MGRTALFQNLGLRIYITRDDFVALIANGHMFCDLWYRGVFAAGDCVHVSLDFLSGAQLQEWYDNERQVIDTAKRAQQDKHNELYLSKRKAGKIGKRKRVQRATDHVSTVE